MCIYIYIHVSIACTYTYVHVAFKSHVIPDSYFLPAHSSSTRRFALENTPFRVSSICIFSFFKHSSTPATTVGAFLGEISRNFDMELVPPAGTLLLYLT